MSGNNRKQCNFNTFEMSTFSSLRLHAMTALTVLESHIPTYLYSFAGNALRVWCKMLCLGYSTSTLCHLWCPGSLELYGLTWYVLSEKALFSSEFVVPWQSRTLYGLTWYFLSEKAFFSSEFVVPWQSHFSIWSYMVLLTRKGSLFLWKKKLKVESL